MANPTKHRATLNSISRNNDRNQRSSLMCKIQEDVAHSPLQPRLWMNAPIMFCNHTTLIQRCFPWQASTVHLCAEISNIHSTLFTLHLESSLSEPSVNLWVSQSGAQCQIGLSCLPLASFQLDFTFSLPLGLLLVSKRPPMSRCENVLPGGGYDTDLLCS